MNSIYNIRIINCDFYMTSPIEDVDVMFSEFRGSSVSQVPIIRIFGTTDFGKKICLHVHGVFPYLYIPYDGVEDFDRLKYQIAANIDKAINISFGQASSTSQHVYKITLVSGIPFYGYHKREHQFFKIYLYNPALIRKVSNMLLSEVILGKQYQPHESHIPYILQFMIDYNLHGMSKITLNHMKFRIGSNTQALEHIAQQSFLPPSITKLSFCELEGDTLAENIMNRREIAAGIAINPGIAALWQDEKQRRRNKNDDSLIGPCLTLINSNIAPTKSHTIFQRALFERLAISEDHSDKSDQNPSVYPAETPEYKSVQNASIIDFHTPSSSADTTLNASLDLDATLTEDANDLLEILQDLGEKSEIEEADSILSQVGKEDDVDEDYFDLSLPIDVATPIKHAINVETIDSDEDLWNDTLVPQVDGNFDGDSSSSDDDIQVPSNVKLSNRKKTQSKYSALPICVTSSQAGDLSQDFKRLQNKTIEPKVKRILSFTSNLPEKDTTIVEESLECRLNPKKTNICSSKMEEQVAKFSKAELYDLETSFRPKEGCSTILTQSSDNSNIDSTQESVKMSQTSELSCKSDSSHSSQYVIFESGSNSNFADMNDQSTVAQQSILKIVTNSENRTENFSSSSESIPPYQVNLKPEKKLFGIIAPLMKAPSRSDVENSLSELEIPKIVHEVPHYSNVEDVSGVVEVGHSVLKIPSKTTLNLEEFKTFYPGIDNLRKTKMPSTVKPTYENIKRVKLSFCGNSECVIAPLRQAPTKAQVLQWQPKEIITPVVKKPERTKIYLPMSPGKMDESDLELSLTISPCDIDVEEKPHQEILTSPVLGKFNKKRNVFSQNNSCAITGNTLDNTYGFKVTPDNFQNAKTIHEPQYLTIASMEMHFNTRGDLKPDPAYDSIRAIFYSITEDAPQSTTKTGMLAVNSITTSPTKKKFSIMEGVGVNCDNVECVESEEELLKKVVELIQHYDPDILIGYEIEMLSWGYLIDRAYVLGMNLVNELSRIKGKAAKCYEDEKALKITGRIVLDVWRLLRHEIALQSYTFENIIYHILHKRVPLFSFKELSFWWNHRAAIHRHRTIEYYLLRVEGNLKIIEQLDLIGRTSELARLFGIQFYEVLSRGSQFRVESMMLRLAKPLNYIPVSPNVQQRAKMKAPEYLPLILEPESKFYVDPVIVLDFQSLYPSIIIAYNYCFSTCIGKVKHLGRNTPFEFGATQLKVSRARMQHLLSTDSLNFSPCGVAFVKGHVRDGIMPRMLREILDTRLMVKKSMKENKEDKLLQKVLHNRQLGLKLIANVTYGYTAANFSGRMPAVELGDSVVSKGRETLQRAIAMVENTPEWGAKVVYGDTDSLFVLIPGRSRGEAFEIGEKIADAVTNDNPDPVKLKLEKIYQPCILQTKKRYVGYMYESADQKEPVYNAKGIETVRRDGCPAVSKMLEKCLRLLFESKDVSLVKKYVLNQFFKIVAGRVSLQDLTFAKEYRGASGYRPGACVPALELSRKWTAIDKRNEPRSGERVPYIVAHGPPGLPLIRLVHSPRDFLSDPSLRPNVVYYITKVIIPPINRCFQLIGADLNIWFNQMPRKQFQYLPTSSPGKKCTISQYFASNHCAVCSRQSQNGLCDSCSMKPQDTVVILCDKIRRWEKAHYNTNLICQSCSGSFEQSSCISLDCPVLYKVNQTERDVQQANYVRQLLKSSMYRF